MKTLTILFENNVFYVLPEWPNPHFDKGCHSSLECEAYSREVPHCGCYNRYTNEREQSKANAIRIDNPELLPQYDLIGKGRLVQHGDIFQVEGFEYKLNCDHKLEYDMHSAKVTWCNICKKHVYERKAILKLAKEEEPKCNPISLDYDFGYNQAIADTLKTLLEFDIPIGNPVFNQILKLKK